MPSTLSPVCPVKMHMLLKFRKKPKLIIDDTKSGLLGENYVCDCDSDPLGTFCLPKVGENNAAFVLWVNQGHWSTAIYKTNSHTARCWKPYQFFRMETGNAFSPE